MHRAVISTVIDSVGTQGASSSEAVFPGSLPPGQEMTDSSKSQDYITLVKIVQSVLSITVVLTDNEKYLGETPCLYSQSFPRKTQ